MPFEEPSLAYVEDRSAPPGVFGKNRAHMKVARSRKNFAYGVCDRENGPCLPSAAR